MFTVNSRNMLGGFRRNISGLKSNSKVDYSRLIVVPNCFRFAELCIDCLE